LRSFYSWQLSALLFVGMAAGAQENPTQSSQSQEAPTGSATPPSVTVTGEKPRNEPTLPKLAPDQMTDCYAKYSTSAAGGMDITAMTTCQFQLARDQRIVIDKCVNHEEKSAPPIAVQACTELLDRNILQGRDRFYLFLNRALAFVAQGDKPHALDDYNAAVKFAPKNAQPYYYRGVFFGQGDVDAALRDFDMALSIDPKLVPALRQRGIIRLTQKNLDAALADFSEAVRLQPKTAVLWSDRGQLRILARDFDGGLKDEAEAIRLDPKLARAYFLRGAAFGDMGDSANAVKDIRTAVDMDPSLDRYISTNGKTASIALPPL
jgi:tetratricopeptide (TPR) repeat protein